ncbi:glycosyltransferase family protein [Belnapia sp. T6]|uniref:Glycosyltransferase family protein n=1 Tax=Belnapia mucosa TaxID=2804532 RepID=A0ABS1VA42_9PROT|nr:glycosyltransferase family protein [Belnapia mucosa]
MHAAGSFAAAEGILRPALAVRPGDGFLWNALGVMAAEQGRPAEAVRCYRRALALGAGTAGLWTNLGNALTKLRQHATALACQEEAVRLAPEEGAFRYNLGITLAEADRHAEAVTAFDAALRLSPAHPMARWDRGRSLLHLSNLPRGFADYEVRLENGLVPPRPLPGARWDGRPFPGKRLLLLAEQGFGDTLWASRTLPRLRALGGEVVLECQEALIPLLAPMGWVDRIIPAGAPLPEADWHAHLCSLPGLFAPRLEMLSGEPWLRAPEARLPAMRQRLNGAEASTLRVGIVWSGSTAFPRNAERALTLERFLMAFDLPGVQLFSLQKGPPEAELRAAGAHRIIDLAPHLRDFADTAAAVAELDLVIMTDSAVAHLAGALGCPVWLLLSRPAHWLWMQERADSPWYRSMRLFRPRAEGDWNHVLDGAAAALMRLVRQGGKAGN